MNRTALCLAFTGAVALTGCRDTDTTPVTPSPDLRTSAITDLSVSHDGGTTSPDLSVVSTIATVHDVLASGADKGVYTLNNVVITGIAIGSGHSKTSGTCNYEAYIQDASTAPPNAIRLYLKGPKCTPTTDAGVLGACDCPFPGKIGNSSPFDAISTSANLGDIYSITGTFSLYTPSGMPTQHEFDIVSMTMTGTGGKITPIEIGDADAAKYKTGGPGYQTNESQLVTIKPSAPAAVSTPDTYGAFTYAGANFSGNYRYFYNPPKDAGTFPAGSFTSITGIAAPGFGGTIEPRIPADFVP